MFFVTTPLKLCHCKVCPCVIPSKPHVTIALCSSITISPKTMSLKNYVPLSKPYVTIPLCSYVTMSSKPMFFCLIKKSLTPLGAPLSVGEELGVRLYHGSERTKLIH